MMIIEMAHGFLVGGGGGGGGGCIYPSFIIRW
jgi:hypothetical protein